MNTPDYINAMHETGPYGFRVWYSPARDLMPVTNIEYQGRRIVANKYNGTFENVDTMGFNVPVAFVVLDEFDDPALPLIQQWFWSPHDAAAAIRFVDWVTPLVKKGTSSKWPTTVAYEYNQMVAFRRNFDQVYGAIKDIEQMCREAVDFDDNVTENVLSRLKLLRQTVAEGR